MFVLAEPPASRSNVPHPVETSLLRAMSIVDELIAGRDPMRGGEATGRDGVELDGGELDLVDHVLGAAWFNQYQLGLLVSLVAQVQSSEQTVTEIIDRAQRLATASPGAIGAAATLLTLVRDGDEYAVAECFGRAQACFDDDELLAGSAALTASLCLTIADTLGLDASVALREMIEAIVGAPTVPYMSLDVRTETPPAIARCEGRANPGADRRRVDRTRCVPARLGATSRFS